VAQLFSLGEMSRPEKNNSMKTWLKLIGSAKQPITAGWSENYIGFRKKNRPSIQIGDRLFLYAPGRPRLIFALAEAVGEPKHDPNYDSNKEGSCWWTLPVSYLIPGSTDTGVSLEDIRCERDLRLSVRQASHVELRPEESQLAYRKLKEKQNA
jgi:hypothetical protein